MPAGQQTQQIPDVSTITKVTIPSTTTAIEENAFRNYRSLLYITIPNSVTSIQPNVFQDCANLQQFNISKAFLSQQYPDVEAFRNHIGLVCTCNIIANEELANATVYTCVNGENLAPQKPADIQDPTKISENQFSRNSKIKAVKINDAVTAIEEAAFYDCTSLEVVDIPDKITAIPPQAFWNCKKLKRVNILGNVQTIDNYAFSNCSNLNNINIPNTVTNIGSFAFKGCSSLQSINIPDSVIGIGSRAFYGCTSLKSVSIPYGVEEIKPSTFYGCASIDSITLPNSVQTIGDLAFARCTSIESITIPNSVQTIGNAAFRYCTNLNSIIMPDSVQVIEGSAFYGCTALKSISIPNSVQAIGERAFTHCVNLNEISISQELYNTYKDEKDFRQKLGLNSTCKITTQPQVAIQQKQQVLKQIQKQIVAIHKLSEQNFAITRKNKHSIKKPIMLPQLVNHFPQNKNQILNSVIIKNGRLEYKNDIVSLTLGKDVKNIEFAAFADYPLLKNVTIQDGVTTIKNYAFVNCPVLESINIPKTVTRLGEKIFDCCPKLKKLTISQELLDTYIDEKDFRQQLCLAADRKITRLEHQVVQQNKKSVVDSEEVTYNQFDDTKDTVSSEVDQKAKTIKVDIFSQLKASKNVIIQNSLTNTENVDTQENREPMQRVDLTKNGVKSKQVAQTNVSAKKLNQLPKK